MKEAFPECWTFAGSWLQQLLPGKMGPRCGERSRDAQKLRESSTDLWGKELRVRANIAAMLGFEWTGLWEINCSLDELSGFWADLISPILLSLTSPRSIPTSEWEELFPSKASVPSHSAEFCQVII